MTDYLLLIMVSFFLGWYSREIYRLLNQLKYSLNTEKEETAKKKESIAASFAEPLTALEVAAEEEQEKIKALNPDI